MTQSSVKTLKKKSSWKVVRDVEGLQTQTNDWIITYCRAETPKRPTVYGTVNRIYSYSVAVKIKNILAQQLKEIEEGA